MRAGRRNSRRAMAHLGSAPRGYGFAADPFFETLGDHPEGLSTEHHTYRQKHVVTQAQNHANKMISAYAE